VVRYLPVLGNSWALRLAEWRLITSGFRRVQAEICRPGNFY